MDEVDRFPPQVDCARVIFYINPNPQAETETMDAALLELIID
jgi:hypothetical protein